MTFRKLFIYTTEGLALLGVVFAVNANMLISAYYYTMKIPDKIKDIL